MLAFEGGVIQTYGILLSRRVLSCGKGDSIFSSVGKFKKSRTSEGREKKVGRTDGWRGAASRRDCGDVSKTRNSLDPGSSCAAVVVHAINQPIDPFPTRRPREKLLPSS